MTVYYMQDPLYDTAQKSKVKAFQPVRTPYFSDIHYALKISKEKLAKTKETSIDANLSMQSGLPHVRRQC